MAYDSRDVQIGTLFFALRGMHQDGHRYISQAVDAGAAAVVCMDLPEKLDPEVAYVVVEDSRWVMSPIASSFYDDPSSELTIIGVTGTDGKSSTSFFIQQLLEKSGKKCGMLTTVQFKLGDSSQKNYLRQSTPEASEIHRLLRQMRTNGCTHAVVEATSHGLSKINNRLGDVKFDVGVLTNISHEHLEFHKTLERYMNDKANLFRALPAKSGRSIINFDEEHKDVFRQASACPVYTYSIAGDEADFAALDIREYPTRQEFTLQSPDGTADLKLPQPGRFNIENCLAALAAVSRLPGEKLQTYLPFVEELRPIKGRMVPVREGQPFEVIVDYAHTPGSFEKLFPALRTQVKGQLIAVFSSAGERDVEKRSILGRIASQYCDRIVLADEDPRGERPMDILEQVAEGCTGMERGRDLFLIEDRPTAIRHAFSLADHDDLVILLGKGHEGSIIYADGPIPWDEEEQARSILHELGYSEKE